MADEDKESKTEDASSKKLEDAKNDGNVAKSQEVPGAAILTVSSIYLLFFAGSAFESIREMMLYTFSFIGKDVDSSMIYSITYTIVQTFIITLAPLFMMVIFLAIVFNVMQFGFIVIPISLKFEKLDPIKGFSNVFSFKKLLEALKLSAKLTIIIGVMVIILMINWNDILAMMDMTITGSIRVILQLTAYFIASILLIIIIFAIIDFLFTRHYYLEGLKMTKQEVKEEHKSMEGDPIVKSRIRQIQMKMSRQRMMKDVAQADVVITNPTHYAVALKYKRGEQKAPMIVGKGVDYMALKIKDVARENKIPIVENPSMARTLYDQVEIEQEMPEEFYSALVEIFTYVFELNK
jgi:flagellar biosynthetic protein FlhB